MKGRPQHPAAWAPPPRARLASLRAGQGPPPGPTAPRGAAGAVMSDEWRAAPGMHQTMEEIYGIEDPGYQDPAKAAAMRFQCEDCMQKVASFGFTYDKRRRWCGTCRRSHIGAEDVVHRKCEGCNKARPVFGLPADGRRRWCSACAKGVNGTVNINLLQKAKTPYSTERELLPPLLQLLTDALPAGRRGHACRGADSLSPALKVCRARSPGDTHSWDQEEGWEDWLAEKEGRQERGERPLHAAVPPSCLSLVSCARARLEARPQHSARRRSVRRVARLLKRRVARCWNVSLESSCGTCASNTQARRRGQRACKF